VNHPLLELLLVHLIERHIETFSGLDAASSAL
jgi:hypothetical protein